MTRQRQKKAAAKRTRPTLRDVAEVVGVSVNTVSTVLNDRPRAQDYAQETRERIRVAAKELGYIPNPLAQVLKKSRTNMLGVVMFFQQSNFYASTLQAVEDVAQSKGFEIVSADMGRDLGRFEQCVHLLTAWRVEGIVAAIGGHAVDREILETVQNGGTPVVIVGADLPEERTPSVFMDNYGAGRQIAAHLLDLGHTRVGVLAGNRENSTSENRLAGICSVFEERNHPLTEKQILRSKSTKFELATGYKNAGQMLTNFPEVTAMICINDEMAIGAMTHLRERGIRIPQDISISGFDDAVIGDSNDPGNRLGLHTVPPLTTLRIPVHEIGRAAGDMLITRINDSDEEMKTRQFPAELIIRNSTGPAAG